MYSLRDRKSGNTVQELGLFLKKLSDLAFVGPSPDSDSDSLLLVLQMCKKIRFNAKDLSDQIEKTFGWHANHIVPGQI